VGSPPPAVNFDEVPTVVGGPYEYGVPGAVHAVFREKQPATTSAGAVPTPAGGGGAPPPVDP
jgi:cytochrome c oxidase subunit 1